MWLLCQIPPQPLALCTRLYLPLLQMDAPSELTPQVWSHSPERRTLKKVVFAGPSGTSTQKFGVRTVWNTDEDVRRLLAPPSPAFHRIRGFCAPSHSPNIERAVKEAIRLVPRLRRATHQSDGVCHSLPEADM